MADLAPPPLQVWDDEAFAVVADPARLPPPLDVPRELQAAAAAARDVQRIDPGQLLVARPLLRVLDNWAVVCEVQGLGLAVLPVPGALSRRRADRGAQDLQLERQLQVGRRWRGAGGEGERPRAAACR